MLGLIASLAFALPHSGPAFAPGAQEPAARPSATKVYDEAADGRAQIAAALAVAKRENQRVLVQWGANRCGWCIKLHDTLANDEELRRKILYEYEVVYVDVGKGDKHADLVAHYGAGTKEHGLPFWTILDAEGRVVAGEATEPLEKDGAHDPAKVMEVLTRWQAPYPKAQEVLDAALARAKEADKRLWVSFGAPWCGWCHRLEDWVHSEVPAALLAEDFEFLKIDQDRTIGGVEMLAKYRGSESGGIPWFVFLAADGTVLADSGKGGENLGCPWTDEELARFRAILAKVRVRLDDEKLDRLIGSLRAQREKLEAEAAARRAAEEANGGKKAEGGGDAGR